MNVDLDHLHPIFGISQEQATAWLSHISYKPGWCFSASGIGLQISIQTRESSEHGYAPKDSPLVQNFGFMLPIGPLDENEFRDAVLRAIMFIEMHEMREFFRWKGEMIFNPHDKTRFDYEIRTRPAPFRWEPIDGGVAA